MAKEKERPRTVSKHGLMGTNDQLSASPGRGPRRWPWVLVVVAIVVFLTLVLLPEAMRWGAQRWFEDQGMEGVEVVDVDFNPFTGELEVSTLRASHPQEGELRWERAVVRVDWWPLARRRAHVEGVALEGAVIDIRRRADGSLSIGGLPLGGQEEEEPFESREEEPARPWGIGVHEVALRDVRIRYHEPGLEVDLLVHRARVLPLVSWDPHTPTPIEVEAEINGGRLTFKGEARPFREEIDITAELEIADLPLAWLAPLLDAKGVGGLNGIFDTELSLEGRVVPNTTAAGLKVRGRMALRDLQAAIEGGELHRLSLEWEGDAELSRAGDDLGATIDGDLVVKGVDATLASPPLHLRQERLQWRGRVDYGSEAVPEGRDFLLAADVDADGITATQKDKGELLAIDRLALKGVRLAGTEEVRVEGLHLTGLRSLEQRIEGGAEGGSAHALTLGELMVDAVRVADTSQVEVAAVRLNDLQALVVRVAGGGLEVARWLPAATGDAPRREGEVPPIAAHGAELAVEEEAAPPEGGRKLTVRLGRLEIGGKSGLHFQDHSVDPLFRIAADPLILQVSEVDSSRPQQKSPVLLDAKLGKYGETHVEGAVAPFATRPTMELKGNLTSFDLAPLTSYTTAAVGYRLQSGHLDGNFDLAVDQGIVKAESEWVANKLEMVRLKGVEDDSLSDALGIPVNTALSLLRDREDNVRLQVPLEGDLRDPELGIGSTLRQVGATATAAAVKTAVIHYIAPLSSPLGVALLAGKAVSLAAALRFDPVIFPAGEAILDAEAGEYLDGLAERLRDRPRVRLNLCGIATLADLPPSQESAATVGEAAPAGEPPDSGSDLQGVPGKPPVGEVAQPSELDTGPALPLESLRTLAQQRGDAVKDYLTSQGGIEPERLFVCSPEVDEEAEAVPRVEIAL